MTHDDWLDPVVEGERAQQAAEEELAWAEEREREEVEAHERKRQERMDLLDAQHDAWVDREMERAASQPQPDQPGGKS